MHWFFIVTQWMTAEDIGIRFVVIIEIVSR